MAEVARSRNRIDTLITEVERRDGLVTARDEEIATLKLQLSPFENELASRTQSIQQLKEQIRDRDEDIDAMRLTMEDLTREIADRDLHIATMTVDGVTAGGPASSIPPDAFTAHERLRQRIEELSELSMQMKSQRAQLTEQQRELVALKKTIDIAKSDVVEHQPERALPAAPALPPERPSETRSKWSMPAAARSSSRSRSPRRRPRRCRRNCGSSMKIEHRGWARGLWTAQCRSAIGNSGTSRILVCRTG